MACTNQLDQLTAEGTLRVRLPSRERGLPEFPAPPDDHGLAINSALMRAARYARVGAFAAGMFAIRYFIRLKRVERRQTSAL